MNVRRTRPEDLEELVGIHAGAFGGQMGPQLGRRYLRAFLSWFSCTPGALSLVAEENGALLGYVFGAPDGYGPGLTRQLLPAIALGAARHWPRIVRHPSFRRQLRARAANLVLGREPKTTIHASTPSGCFCLVGIGTAAAARGQGVGRALVEAFCREVTRQPVILDVFKDNAPARVLYERTGFQVLAEDGRVVRMLRAPAR